MPVGYSGTSLVRKLGIKPEHRVVLVGSPPGWSIDDLPAGVSLARRVGRAPADVVLAFFRGLAPLQKAVPALAERIDPNGMIWIAWPRRAGGHTSDITDNAIRDAVLPLGLVDVKVAALGEDWSGLKVVWRKELRAGR